MVGQAGGTTDPSKELAELGRQLRSGASDADVRVVDGLARNIDVDPHSPELLEIVAVTNRRLLDLDALAQRLSDSEVDPTLRSELLQATKSFMQLLGHKQSAAKWDEARKRLLSDDKLAALRWFSQIARKHRPLRIVSEPERHELTQQIAETIKSVLDDQSLDEWMRVLLLQGLNRLNFVVARLPYFGHELAIAEIVLAKQKADVVFVSLEATSKGANSAIWKYLAVISLLGNIFVLPPQAVEAVEHYKSGGQSAVVALIEDVEKKKPLPLLSAPVAIKPEEAKPKSGDAEYGTIEWE